MAGILVLRVHLMFAELFVKIKIKGIKYAESVNTTKALQFERQIIKINVKGLIIRVVRFYWPKK